jgi:hypothetical protein
MKKEKLFLIGTLVAIGFAVMSLIDSSRSSYASQGTKVLAQKSNGEYCCLKGDRDCGAADCPTGGGGGPILGGD